MKNLCTAIFVAVSILLVHNSAFAIGGVGATCNPSTASWGSCSLAPVPWAASVTNTVNIPAGHYATPFQATQANTEYILQGDMTADGTAIEMLANYVIINLNGHTVTYNQTLAGEGVSVATYNRHHLAVRNGTIIQSTANLGKIISIGISSGGTGYSVNDVLTLTGGTVNATATVSTIDGAGAVTGVTLSSPGKGYEGTWNFKYPTGYRGEITGGTGSGVALTVTATISEGDIAGSGKAPVSSYVGATDYSGGEGMHIANLYLKIYGRDMGGVVVTAPGAIVEEVTVADYYRVGTLKNRDQGNAAIKAFGDGSVVRNNTVTGARHKGIWARNNCRIYGNHVSTDNIATNGAALSGGEISPVIYNNTAISRGEHPLGIMWYNETGNTTTAEFYGNYFDSRTTAIGVEYGGAAYAADPTATITGNGAVGFRTTFGGDGINFHDNEIHVTTDARYVGTYSPTGAVAYVRGRARGLMIGSKAGDTMLFARNTITALDEDGTGLNYGMVCTSSESDSVFFIGNTVTANVTNIALGDEYGACKGFALFTGNTLVKAGEFSSYATLSNQSGGLFDSEARIVDNVYQNGASVDSINFHPAGYGAVSVYFGSIVNGEYKYSYRLHDNNNTSSTLLREDFDPATTLGYSNPATPSRLSLAGRPIKLAEPGP